MFEVGAAVMLSALVTGATTPFFIRLAHRIGLVDDPRRRRHPAQTHRGIIPRAGGLPILLGISIGTLVFIPINKILLGVLIGAFLIVLMGVFDDLLDLSPYKRFIANIAIVLLVILFGLGVPYVSNPLGGVIRLDTTVITFNFFGEHSFLLWANLFAVVWIVAIMNFVNWSKGVDGQLPGFVAIACLFLGILAYRFSAHDISTKSVALLAFVTTGAFAGFLPWNMYPQKIMPGYGGGALAGYFLGVLSILSWGKLGTMILVLSVPITDAVYVMMRRIVHLKSPFLGDAGHFHHRLLELGWGKQRVAVFYWIVSFLFGVASLFFGGAQKLMALVAVFIFLAFFIIVINRVKMTIFKDQAPKFK